MPKEAWGVNINPKSQLDLLSNKDTIMKIRRNHLSSFWYTSKVPSMIVTNLFVVSFSIHIFESPYAVKAIQQVCNVLPSSAISEGGFSELKNLLDPN